MTASTTHIGSYAFYDVVGVRRVRSATVFKGSNGMRVCNIMRFCRWGWLYFFFSVFRRYWA